VDLMLMMLGIGVALWVLKDVLPPNSSSDGPVKQVHFLVRNIAAILGGLSLIGVPLLLMRRRKIRGPQVWGPGRQAWFAHGMAAWLLWPPIVIRRLAGSGPASDSMSYVCWLYGTPLMGLYVTAALLAGGWLSRRGRRRLRRSWREVFGVLLACGWACTGLYILYLIYAGDLGD
jgi:hypothetical protein